MPLKSSRLDRFLATQLSINKRDVKALLAAGRILVDGELARDAELIVHAFSDIRYDDKVLQQRQPRYFMLHKPAGLLSATTDTEQTTVMDLFPLAQRGDLHIAGRLDKDSTGLLLLSDDSRWSKKSMAPEARVAKVYRVEVRDPISAECVQAFAQGIHFPFEDVYTLPAELQILAPCLARVTLCEGRYHQIKRMFGRFRNPVLSLHRERIGALELDPTLAPGQYRALRADEIQKAVQCAAVGAKPEPKATGGGA